MSPVGTVPILVLELVGIDKQLLAFSRGIAQYTSAIFILACLSATRPFSGRSFQVIHITQIVRFHVRLVRGIYVMEAK